MSINCKVILEWDATPKQSRAVGAALWGWCNRSAGNAGIYQYLDNQALADLLDGRLPARGAMARSTDLPHVDVSVQGETALDHQGILESLRRALPSEGIADVRVDGMSWRRTEVKDRLIQP